MHATQLAAHLPPLLLEARRIAASLQQGPHGRRRIGIGESFWQFRPYHSGDSVTQIDWRQSARGDRLFVREREWEALQTVTLWADRSGSMQYKSRRDLPTKSERAHLLLLALATALIDGGEKITWCGTEPQKAHNHQMLDALAATLSSAAREESSLPPDIKLSRHGHMILCSDFLHDPEQWQRKLRDYAAQGLQGLLLHIADPMEAAPNLTGRVRLQSCEAEPDLLLPNAAEIRAAYMDKWQAHGALLKLWAQSAGWGYVYHDTSSAPHHALRHAYNLLAAQ